MSDNKSSNNQKWGTIIALGAAATAGALLAWFAKPDREPTHHQHPTRNFKDAPPLYDSKCAICLENHDVMMLPCEHSFDSVCIREWFTKSLKTDGRMICPTCRFAIPRNMENEYRHRLNIDQNM